MIYLGVHTPLNQAFPPNERGQYTTTAFFWQSIQRAMMPAKYGCSNLSSLSDSFENGTAFEVHCPSC